MKITDIIYGQFEIIETILLDILASKPLQRLKKINQCGIPDKYAWYKGFSRYEHSVGVVLLLKKLGASFEEQVAGLLHDVSHLAFSHTADWLLHDGKKGKESYHDLVHYDFVKGTEIPVILKKHGLDLKRILDESNFTLLEKDSPDICVDRIDYFLRQLYYLGELELIEPTINNLMVFKNELVFDNFQIGLSVARRYLKMQMENWSDKRTVTMIHIFSEALRAALDEKIITIEDFYRDDEYIIDLMEKSEVKSIQDGLKLLKGKNILEFYQKTGERVYKKFRYIDPRVLSGNKVFRVSEIRPNFKKELENCRSKCNQGIVI